MATNYRKENINSTCTFTLFYVGYSPRNFWAFHRCCFYMSCTLFCWPLTERKQCWVYVFNQPNLNTYISSVSCEDRACHLDDLPNLFRHPNDVTGVEDSYFWYLSNLMVSYIGNFVRTANPDSNEVSPKWPRYNATPHCITKKQENQYNLMPCSNLNSQNYPLSFLKFGAVMELLRYPHPRIVRDFRAEKCNFWDSVGYKKE